MKRSPTVVYFLWFVIVVLLAAILSVMGGSRSCLKQQRYTAGKKRVHWAGVKREVPFEQRVWGYVGPEIAIPM